MLYGKIKRKTCQHVHGQLAESWLIFLLFVSWSFYIFCKDKYVEGRGLGPPSPSGFVPSVFQEVLTEQCLPQTSLSGQGSEVPGGPVAG